MPKLRIRDICYQWTDGKTLIIEKFSFTFTKVLSCLKNSLFTAGLAFLNKYDMLNQTKILGKTYPYTFKHWSVQDWIYCS